jgi:putative ABC transport system permease protein
LDKGSLPTEPNSLILSHEMAKNFFNEVNPVGKYLTHPTYGSFKITGVLKPFKKQTQFRSDVMVSMASYANFNLEATKPQSWSDFKTHTFVKLPAKAQPNSLDLALNEIAKKSNENILSIITRICFNNFNCFNIFFF